MNRVSNTLLLRTATAIVLLVSLAVPPLAGQEGKVIDRVVAVVEDRAVFESELELEYKNYLMQKQRTSLPEDERKQVRRDILEGLINDLLMTVHAEKEGVDVGDSEVDEVVERRINENKSALGGEEAFRLQLEREGMTLQQLRQLYREKFRARMLIERLLYREVVVTVEVKEPEVKQYYREHVDELPKRPATVTLAHILLMPIASEPALQETRERIDEIYALVKAGGDFAEHARTYSEGPSASNGGSLGYIRLEDLNNPAFESAARNLTVGEVSEPVLTEFGWHIIKLEDVSGERVLIRHILVKVEAGDGDIAGTAELAERIRREILEGAEFGDMASRYSDDERTKDSGGEVGEIPLESLPEFFLEMLKGVEVGEISPVVRESKGFRIVKVLARNPERDYTYDEARDELRGLIEQQKKQERYKEYVDGLRDLYYVEVKEDL
ncbi:MAG: peptidylprolyl isomerase [bacterium]|nr:MAG: peptidylprolyl isomerase [bacterium]